MTLTATKTGAEPMGTDVLSKIDLFAEMDEADRRELVALLQTREFPADTVIFNVGQPGDEFFIIKEGAVLICHPDGSGQDVPLASLGPGQFFGEIALLDTGRRTATARASRPTVLLSLQREPFHAFVRKHPSAALHMMGVLSRRQRETNERLREIRNVNEEVAAHRTGIQRMAERIAEIGASELWLLFNLFFFAGWMVFNIVRGDKAFDNPPTFSTLSFMISLEAIILSMFVLNSQKRQSERDRIKADLDYQVNKLAHIEIMSLHQKADRLEKLLQGLNRGPRDKSVS